MFPCFSLVLMVNHACNLRCTYCYTGRKFNYRMPMAVASAAIDRAVASVEPGGTLDLGFFGGEPLLEAAFIERVLRHARKRTRDAGIELCVGLTTNGAVTDARAWSLMTRSDVDLAVSCDGLPEVHDAHRLFPDGGGSSDPVLRTLRKLVARKRDFRVVLVARPDTVARLPDGIRYLLDLGVRRFEPNLDLWCRWTSEDVERLDAAIVECAEVWRHHLPDIGIGWFDEKAALLAEMPLAGCARCGFGQGEVAVAPTGRLYPCERLIGEDAEHNPMRLPGNALDGGDFLALPSAPCRSHDACRHCAIAAFCNTTCRCSNYVRTGDVRKPDRLLCMLNEICLRETAAVLQDMCVSA